MAKKQSRFKRYFKRYNTVPAIMLFILMTIALATALISVENWDNKILFIIAFIALTHALVSNIEKTEVQQADKKVEHISSKSTAALKIELNAALKECKKNKYRDVEVHIVDSKNAFLIITE